MVPINPYVFKARIEQAAGLLTPAELRIADYVQDHYAQIVQMSAAELAEKTDTSPATVVRFCRDIGFKGFNEFKMSLEYEALQERPELMDLRQGDSVALVRQKVLALNKSVLDTTVSHDDNEIYETVASILSNASQVLLIGDGGSGCSVKSAYDLFLQAGIRCTCVSDPMFEIMTIANMSPNEVLFTISHTGRIRNTLENLKYAKSIGVTTIGLVGQQRSPMDQYLDYKILTGSIKQDFFSSNLASRISELHVVSVIYSMMILRNARMNEQYATFLHDAYEVKRVAQKQRKKKQD